MKLLTVIVHTEVQQALTTVLRELDVVSGYTFTQVEGHGVEQENDAFLSAKDPVLATVPRTRVEILLEDKDVDAVLAALRDPQNKLIGQGAFWVIPVAQGGHLQ